MPAGACTVWNTGVGLGVRYRFAPAQVRVVHAYNGTEHVLLEVRTKRVKLVPGAEMSLRHSYRVVRDSSANSE